MQINRNLKSPLVFTYSRLLLILLALSPVFMTNDYLHRSLARPATTFTVTTTNDSGTGSLRQAILDSNSNPGTDRIVFDIAPGGVQTITLATPLPTITDPVIVDGSTQQGFSDTPLIVIDGVNLTGSNNSGLRVSAGNSIVKGLVLINVKSGWGLRLDTAGGNVVQGNYIGIDASGQIRRGNTEGLGIFVSNNNLIGGITSSQRNVIGGSGFENIWVGSETVGNQIKGNFIGTNAQGTASIGPGGSSGYGIENDGYNTIIGGTEPGAGNLISGNGQSGIYLGGRDVIVQGNYIGTDVTGTKGVGNTSSGIYVSGGGGAVIGGTTASARNIISGNSGGITYSAINFTSIGKIQGNYIGTDLTGMVAIPNGTGISVNEPVVIGGTEPGAGNLISGNSSYGIFLSYRDSIIQGNLIGTNVTGSGALENNTQIGIMIADGNNTVGGSQPAAANVISGNTTGIQIGGTTTSSPSNNKIQGNLIGTEKSGRYPIPNLVSGIVMFAGLNNSIGGTNSGEGNIIAFNRRKGIFVSGASGSTTGNSIRQNSIFFNNEMGIDFGAQGVRINDPCDADTGANNFQNYPVLTSAASDGTTTSIMGSLNSMANSTFAVDFFVSPSYDSTNFGEGKIYIGSTSVSTASDCNANINVFLPFRAAGGQFVTATATDTSGNTSEFSQYVRGAGISVKPNFDFDGDGRSDMSVFRPSDGTWYLLRSALGYTATRFGVSTDLIVSADFDGDGLTDIAVFRDGVWYLQQSQLGFAAVQFGQAGDIPAPGDYDGDGKADRSVFRPSNGTWYLQQSTGGFSAIQFGIAEDKPAQGDFDGDGKTDIAVFRPSTGYWYRLNSSNNSFFAVQFGATGDKIVPADYTGDGKTDVAVWRPSSGTWYVLKSEDLSFYGVGFGISSDLPAPGDYDGDGKADPAVYRPSAGTWYMQQSTSGFNAVQFGIAEDKPTPNAFVY